MRKFLSVLLLLVSQASFADACGDLIMGTWKAKLKVKEAVPILQAGIYVPGYSIKGDLKVEPTDKWFRFKGTFTNRPGQPEASGSFFFQFVDVSTVRPELPPLSCQGTPDNPGNAAASFGPVSTYTWLEYDPVLEKINILLSGIDKVRWDLDISDKQPLGN